jgi:hypothetical protein
MLTSEHFIARHRRRPQDFTRRRDLPFASLVLFMCGLLRSSVQNELSRFLRMVCGEDIAADNIDGSAFSHARRKLKPTAFVELNQQLNQCAEQEGDLQRWNGYRLMAIDGSTGRLPKSPEIAECFGGMKARTGHSRPMARISQMFDPLNDLVVDASIAPYRVSERDLAIGHMRRLPLEAIILLDRGYPAAWLFALIRQRGAQFCARLKVKQWKCVRAFLLTGQAEQVVQLPHSAESKAKCKALGLPTDPITVRLVRIELTSGEVEVLATSLLDGAEVDVAELGRLYCRRWPVEESYKRFKSRIQIENFTGKTVLSVRQDFHAAVFTSNLVVMLARPAQAQLHRSHSTRKHSYKLNWTRAFAVFRDCGLCLFFRDNVQELLTKLHRLLLKSLTVVRPGRSYPRPKSFARPNWAPAYKPIS